MNIRKLFPGMGQAVAERTVLRSGEDWADVAERVALGNTKLDPNCDDFTALRRHIGQASILLSGRHLQHGDENQPSRNGAVFTNCSTSILRAPTFLMLLSGSGVGTDYSDDLQVVDLSKMPIVVPIIGHEHKDGSRGYMDLRAAQHFYADHKRHHFMVPDTREGWAAAIEQIELMAFHEDTNSVLLLDFSKVRPSGAPIGGMQNRPASGPHPLMDAIARVARLRGMQLPKWKQAMIADHLLAECVLVGGARRSARIAVKYWKDASILDYINVKRPIEYIGKTLAEIGEIGKKESFLWSANNSVAVDAEFWCQDSQHARDVFSAITRAQYGDRTGEPGFLNVDKLDGNEEGLKNFLKVPFIKGMSPDYDELQRVIAGRVLNHPYKFIVNPCVTGETLIETTEGWKRVFDLINKPFTAIFNGQEYKASGFFSQGRKEVFRIRVAKGTPIKTPKSRSWVDCIKATANHRFWVQKPDGYEDWFKVSDINPGDFLIYSNDEEADRVWKNEHTIPFNEDRFKVKVAAVEKLPNTEKVYDCSVEHVHAYNANRFQSHNCGEIVLSIMSGVCVIGDLVPFHTKNNNDLEESVRLITRALVRSNLMDQIYGLEIKRTNRIGVSLTGIHEFAFKRFGFGFYDLLDEDGSLDFWHTLAWMGEIVEQEADSYSDLLGVTRPHTLRTIKPAGTTSKLFGLTEGAHLPSMREYLRWVQFRNDDPLVAKYAKKGYPTRKLRSYEGTTIVGFPTQPVICTLGMGDKLVTQPEATIEEHFQWLRLLEKYWIGTSRGNQVSYTLKFDPTVVPFEAYLEKMLENVQTVRAVAVLPNDERLSYEYQPEQPIDTEEYRILMETIGRRMHEDVDRAHVDCAGGACPIDFVKEGQ
jgi:hypothetical protein